ncbi:MAG: ferrochelatase, partial [Proteobacteria bacterium]|nr:ferrochelatase [Pseudomonadota bacterium]
MQEKTAIVLVNLGTPDAPDEDSIRCYLKQFLSDPRVVNLPRWLWLSILNLIILRVRPPKLVEKYKLVWGTKDGPIRNITNALAKRVGSLMPEVPVVAAMTYGNPSMSDALGQVSEAERIIVLPLFPQYAGATTG